jgi:tyrosyl-tRNA synthetase
VLNELKAFGISENYFEIKRIGDFENSKNEGFSHINTVAIDYDKTTRNLCGKHKQSPFKSCDALDIVDSKNKINFIEFKELRDNNNIEKWIQHLELPQKIKDSHHVLRDIIKKDKFHHSGKMTKYNFCEKNAIISFDLTDDATKKTAILLRIITVKKIIEKQFHNNYIQGENFNEPICIRMTEFDAEYLNYV